MVSNTWKNGTPERKTLLEKAVAVDVQKSPVRRLTNLIAQRYAKALLGGAR